jgi:hypothetical protein
MLSVRALGSHGDHAERAKVNLPALARANASSKPAVVKARIDGTAATTEVRESESVTLWYGDSYSSTVKARILCCGASPE